MNTISPDSLVVAISRRQKLETLTRRLSDHPLRADPAWLQLPKSLPGGGGVADCYVRLGPTRVVGHRRRPVHRGGGGGPHPQPGAAAAELQRDGVAGEPGLHRDGDPDLAWGRILAH